MAVVDDPYFRHLFDGNTIFNVYNEDVTNLSVGAPGPDLLKDCVKMIDCATQHRLEAEKREEKYYLFQYGLTAGLWDFRDELAKFLSKRYGDPVKREHLILSCGASHGLQILLNTILAPNGIIFVEEVTYMIALEVFKQFPLMKIVTVPMKNDVVDVNSFEKIVSDEIKCFNYHLTNEKIYCAMFYTIPTYHNPTGMCLPPRDCKHLIEIARKHSMVIVCDDVYNLLCYEHKVPPHRMLFYDDPSDLDYTGGNVVSNCSFSKILSPAIRVGWLEAGPRIINIIKTSGILRSGGGVNTYMSGVIASLLKLGIEDEYLDKLIEIYRNRLNVVCETLNRHLPNCCSYRRPEGGYFLWIHLPEGLDTAAFLPFCEERYKVTAIPGNQFSYTKNHINFLRISIAFHTKERLVEAIRGLCTALLEYIRDSGCHNISLINK